jgi:ferritin-like protein
MIVTYFYTILELSIKSLKEGTITSSLAEIRDETQKWAQKKYNGVEQG